MSEREKMLAGGPYDPLDADLAAGRAAAVATLIAFNNEPDEVRRMEILGEILGSVGPDCEINPTFYCDYGTHIHLGADVFVNSGCVFLDCAEIRVGDHSQFGPGAQLIAATHPTDPALRLADGELSAPVTVGSNCWIGAGAIVCPGVTIGDDTTIGAGSIVVRDVPSRVVAAGNPCRVIRQL